MINKQRAQNNLEPEDVIPDRMIKEFLRQCPYCQITNRLRVPIKAHRFTCASYNPFDVLHLDHIGPLTKDAHWTTGNEYILVIIDAFSRWVELFPTKSTTAAETESVMLNHIGRFGSSEVIHTDQESAFHNELVQELLRLCDTAVRTQYVLPVTSPALHLTQTSFTTYSVQYTQYTLSVHILSSLHSLC